MFGGRAFGRQEGLDEAMKVEPHDEIRAFLRRGRQRDLYLRVYAQGNGRVSTRLECTGKWHLNRNFWHLGFELPSFQL